MVVVATLGVDAEMWLPARQFAVGDARLWSNRLSFQTAGLVRPKGIDAHGR
jgi:hypothetical protein